MKKIISVLLSFGWLSAGHSQDCGNYYFFQDNKTIEMTIYNKKGDESGKQQYKITNVQHNGGTTSAIVNTEMFDKKGKSMAKSSGNYLCKGGVVKVNMKMCPPSKQWNNFKMLK